MTYSEVIAELDESLRRADVLRQGSTFTVHSNNGQVRLDVTMTIKIDPSAHALPAGVSLGDALLELKLVIGEDGDMESIQECSAQVVVDGLNGAAEVCIFALHFDRHDPQLQANELHATYHWQVGGDRISGQNLGTVIHFGGPRFPSHPLDPVLLVDFVLGHFYGTKRLEMVTSVDTERYRRLLFRSQSLLVAPFFAAVHNTLSTNPVPGSHYWPAICPSPA